MDQAVAAILGAGVGSLGATFAAVWAGRQTRWQTKTQMRGQHQQWRRESRRTAFADVIRTSGDLLDSVKQTLMALAETPRNDTTVAQCDEVTGRCFAEFSKARIVADLEAPGLGENLSQLMDGHNTLLTKVSAFRMGQVEFSEVITEAAMASALTGYFVGHAQRLLNDYDEDA
ncbi:hypothetical protein [Streptomyces sp. NBC_01353]|uniref:hypothetical protein n=1 Tax=Streptomyces sp. NBC_01353 TaxID=2903835 RepID=UPI002E3017AA|nr:hypothetical protein [Streptomyces sp. NBC_01353]